MNFDNDMESCGRLRSRCIGASASAQERVPRKKLANSCRPDIGSQNQRNASRYPQGFCRTRWVNAESQ